MESRESSGPPELIATLGHYQNSCSSIHSNVLLHVRMAKGALAKGMALKFGNNNIIA